MAVGNEPSFLSLLDVHEQLFTEFLAHQEALLDRDLARALERLTSFRAHLEDHIRAEDELFAAVFARTDSVSGIPLSLFTGEHRHLRSLLAHYETETRALDPANLRLKRHILELLDEEVLFKQIFLHHDERERNLLYPALDRYAKPEERLKLLLRFHLQEGGGAR